MSDKAAPIMLRSFAELRPPTFDVATLEEEIRFPAIELLVDRKGTVQTGLSGLA